jgi:hypothetical protein
MGAGDSAAEQSRLAAERVARLKRRLDEAERETKPWDSAAVCERDVAERLSQLIPHGWYLLHDVGWPGRPKASLDHVLVGPGGVVVVDAKNWTGEVRVSSGVLWQGRYSRTQSVEGALAQCAAVTSVLAPPHRRFARPLICMAAQPELFGITTSDVAVAGTDRVVDVVLALPEVLDQQTVVELYARLGEQLTQEQNDGGPVVRQAEVRPAVGRPAGRMSVPGVPGVTSGAAKPGRPAAVRPGSRQLAAGTGGSLGKSKAQDAAGGMARLLFLAAFVTFAVYVLPYWGG